MEKESWNIIFNPDQFIQNMLEIDEIEQEELDRDDPYGMMVTNLCHNSCVWMYTIVKNLHEKQLPHLYFVTGSYEGFMGIRKDHSWVECRVKGEETIILDLTVSQFRQTDSKLYIGPKTEKYNEWLAVCFIKEAKIFELIESL